MGCWGLLVSSGQLGMGHLFSCPHCIGDRTRLSLEPALHAFCSLLRIDLFLFFFHDLGVELIPGEAQGWVVFGLAALTSFSTWAVPNGSGDSDGA